MSVTVNYFTDTLSRIHFFLKLIFATYPLQMNNIIFFILTSLS